MWKQTVGVQQWWERGEQEAIAGAQRGLDQVVGGGGGEMVWAMECPLS